MSESLIECVWVLYRNTNLSIYAIADSLVVSRCHVHWAIDEGRRRGFK